MKTPGRIIVIVGPMFAGKTTKLIGELKKAQGKNLKTVVFKSPFDNRYSKSKVVSHAGESVPALILPVDASCTKVLNSAAEKYDVIGIDEGQFWADAEGFVDSLNKLAFDSKIIYVSMLNKDHAGKPLRLSRELIPIADEVLSLNAKCAVCGNESASLTQRLIPMKSNAKLEDMVGGAETYQPRCRNCFELNKNVV